MMKKFLLPFLALLAIIGFLFLLPPFFPMSEVTPPANHGLPWEIEQDETGQTHVFGLSPGVSTLDEAVARFGNDMEIAIIVTANIPKGEEAKDAALEVYYSQVVFGFVRARLILTVDAPFSMIASMVERSIKKDYTRNGGRKFTLHPDDVLHARTLTVVAITLIPNADLDAETIVSRFGPPDTIIRVGKTLQHYLYPDKGLDVVLDSKGKEVLQYVAPADFERRIMSPLKPPEK